MVSSIPTYNSTMSLLLILLFPYSSVLVWLCAIVTAYLQFVSYLCYLCFASKYDCFTGGHMGVKGKKRHKQYSISD